MGYTFKKIQKTPIQKSERAVLQLLRSFLDKEEPELGYFLMNLWGAQGKAITYKDLREAILRGEISTKYLDQWRQDYSKFVTEHLQPKWVEAMDAAASQFRRSYPDWRFDPMGAGVMEWTQTRAAEFVTSSTQAQIDAIRAVVQRAAVLNHLNVDLLARAVRPMVGLYHQQAMANMNYFQTLIDGGTSQKKALDLSIRYGSRQHRYRAHMIARQELAMSYNTGADLAVRQAQAAGYMGTMVKVFCCAADERTCPTCGGLEGAVVGMDEDFKYERPKGYKFTNQHPPVHIMCRCTVMYREIAPPKKLEGSP